MNLRWIDRSFAELSGIDLYTIIALRERVFVVEQKCVYQDCDGLDPVSRHVWAEEPGGAIHAYLRIVPAGAKFAEVSIGRVITAPESRGSGLGKVVMKHGIALVGAVPIRLGAQVHLEKFYNDLGFTRASENYDEDGIPHVEMLRTP